MDKRDWEEINNWLVPLWIYYNTEHFCFVRSGNAIFEKFENLRRDWGGEIKSFPSKLSFRISHGWIEGEVFPPSKLFLSHYSLCSSNMSGKFWKERVLCTWGKQGKMCRGKCGGGVGPERRIKEEEEGEEEEVGGKVCEGIEGCALPRVNVNEKRKERPRTRSVKPWRSSLPPVAVSTSTLSRRRRWKSTIIRRGRAKIG